MTDLVSMARDWQAIALLEAAKLTGTPEGAEKLAESRRYGMLANALADCSELVCDAGRYGVVRSGVGYAVQMKGVTAVIGARHEPDFGQALDDAIDLIKVVT